MNAFSAAAFLGSFLFFQLELIAARLLLPGFGGSAYVWTTSMMFFQGLLFAGYAYAQISLSRLTPAVSTRLHLGLIALPLIILPVSVSPPRVLERPILELLHALARSVALPLFALSTTAPMMQNWLHRSPRAGVNTYRLYAASNAGALVALLSYPFLFEPFATLDRQLALWACGYGLYAVFHLVCAPSSSAPARAPAPATGLSWRETLVWLAFSAGPCAAMLAATNFISFHLGSLPLFWVVPLAIYLCTFILNFKSEPFKADLRFWPLILLAGLLAILLLRTPETEGVLLIVSGLIFNLAILSALGMLCHRQLALSTPAPERAPVFYTCVALGGWLGSLLIGVVVPSLGRLGANIAIDWSISFLLCTAGWVAQSLLIQDSWLGFSYGRLRALAAGIALGGLLMLSVSAAAPGATLASLRNFYGVYRVEERGGLRRFIHGNTVHGIQYQEKRLQAIPLGYFHERSPIGRLLKSQGMRFKRIGIVGLGAGTLAAYGVPGQIMDFFELDLRVTELARKYFSYLSLSSARVTVIPGDARLSLQSSRETYDLLVLDAFTSGAIPMHLVTREAFEIYEDRLSPDGLILINISNRLLDLRPFIAALADNRKLAGFTDDCRPDDSGRKEYFNCRWAALSRVKNWERILAGEGWEPLPNAAATPVWSDQHSSLLPAVRIFGH